MTLVYFSKRYEIIMQGELLKNRKDLMLASLMSDMESTFNLPAQGDPEWEQKNEEVIALYRQISASKNL